MKEEGSRISNGKEAGKSKGQEEHDISVNRGATRCPFYLLNTCNGHDFVSEVWIY